MASGEYPKEGYELLRSGLKICASMTKIWLEIVAHSSKGRPMPLHAAPLVGAKELIEFSREWQKRYGKFIFSSPIMPGERPDSA